MTDKFYRAFEEKYRGSRELIKSRLRAYQPFLEPLLSVYPEARALDLGCGRGEWLEFITELGFSGHGVDIDEGMLAGCTDQGLSAEKSDLLEYIQAVESDSLALVSAFHVVEHISFEALRFLISEAMRALKPGGLLIMETPNPENIVVGTRSFYLDPTHQNPIPSELLSFAAEFSGFKRIKTLRLQEPKELVSQADVNLRELLNGVSPDYAVVAQKQAEPEVMGRFDNAFAKEFGLSLDTLLTRFDSRALSIDVKVSEVEARAGEAEARAGEAEARASEAEGRASEAAARAGEAVANIEALLNSRSWRITAPVRTLGQGFKDVQHPVRGRIKIVLQHAFLFVQRRPRLKRLLIKVIGRLPRLKNRLISIGRQRVVFETSNDRQVPAELEHLTPHARRIYQDLKVAIEKNRKRK